MANDSLICQMKQLVNQIDNGGCGPCGPCPPCGSPCPVPVRLSPSPPLGCPPCSYPYAQVCMTTPPPCLVPTEPKYVKPLQLPYNPPPCQPVLSPEEDFRNRTANFYNNYNVNYKELSGKSGDNSCGGGEGGEAPKEKRPCCKVASKNKCSTGGCPTGFKPCLMEMCPPPGCDTLLPWKAIIQPCPPKPKKKSHPYEPGPCMRPCCKHWKPKGGFCKNPDPCKAHCYDLPVGTTTSPCG